MLASVESFSVRRSSVSYQLFMVKEMAPQALKPISSYIVRVPCLLFFRLAVAMHAREASFELSFYFSVTFLLVLGARLCRVTWRLSRSR